jgi:Xaa-Pro aminopeptidase
MDVSVFKERRSKLAAKIPGAALIVASHPEMVRNNDVHFPYRQDTNLFYLTGFEEPESVLVFRPGRDPEYVLFVRRRDPLKETWDGFRYGPEGAERAFGCDKAYAIEELETILPKLLSEVERVYYRLFHNHEFDHRFKRAVETVRAGQGRSGMGLLPIHDSTEMLGELRIKKTDGEKTWLRKACKISAEAHLQTMKETKPGMNERDLQAIVEYNFRRLGSARDGYGSIVAGGPNACTLHYVFNDEELKNGDLVLIDAGAEYNYLTGDITRTYPVNGKFTDGQRAVYDRVLRVQKNIIDMVKPGIAFKSLQDTAIERLTECMLELGLLKGSVQQNIEQNNFKKYYPHGVSHWLGMDVHDAGLYKLKGESRRVETDMSFTVEPGLYIPADDPAAPAALRGIGIRIEDDILVTDTGCEVMTAGVPKEIKDLEAVIGTA